MSRKYFRWPRGSNKGGEFRSKSGGSSRAARKSHARSGNSKRANVRKSIGHGAYGAVAGGLFANAILPGSGLLGAGAGALTGIKSARIKRDIARKKGRKK